MEYKCNDCNKTYSGYQSLWIHNKKFHNKHDNTLITNDKNDNTLIIPTIIPTINHDNTLIIPTKKYQCRTCNKDFNNFQNRWKHEKICKPTSQVVPINNEIINNLQNKITELENKINTQQIVPLNNSSNIVPLSNTNNSHSHNNNVNNNNNNNNSNNAKHRNSTAFS